MKDDPRIAGHIGDRIFSGGELAIGKPFVENSIKPLGFLDVAIYRIGELLVGVVSEVMILSKHRAEITHLPKKPLHNFRAATQIVGQKLAGLLGEILKNSAGLEDADGLAAAGRIVVHYCRNAVVGGNRQKLRLKLISLTDVDWLDGIGETGFFQKYRDLMSVGRCPVVDINHFLFFLSFDLRASALVPLQFPDYRHLMLVSNCVEYFLRCDRNIKQPDAAGVVHGVGNCGRRTDIGMLADAFCLVGPRTIFGLNQDCLEFWDVRDVGNLVLAEIRCGDLAVIADQLFHQAGADGHHCGAVDLTLVSDGIYDGADVVSRDKAVQLHVARLGVDLHLGDLGNVGGRGAFARDLQFYARRDWATPGGDNFWQSQRFARVVAIPEATGFIDNFLLCALEHLHGLRGQFSPQLAACFDHCVPTDIGRTAPAEAYVDVIGDLGCVTVAAAYLIVRHLHLGGHRLTHDRPA